MLGLAALLLAAQAPAEAAGAPAGEGALLQAFRQACERADDVEAMAADALRAGWTRIADDADPRLARIHRAGLEAVGEGDALVYRTYRGGTAERPLFLIHSHVQAEQGYWANGCRLYDFGAAAPIARERLEAWMERPATGAETLEGVGTQLNWEPGWARVTVQVSHAIAGGAFERRFGFSGNVLIAQSIGGF